MFYVRVVRKKTDYDFPVKTGKNCRKVCKTGLMKRMRPSGKSAEVIHNDNVTKQSHASLKYIIFDILDDTAKWILQVYLNYYH